VQRRADGAAFPPYGGDRSATTMSEDCLYLNIWRPASADTKLPVIVFIHGGSNVSGYTADPVYDGAALATLMVPFLLAAVLFSYFGLQRRAWQQGGDK